ncbi:hypothetical protein VZT92_006224 [Zoarces viviparus]|uniref:Prolactin receptor n=1 Tax=Zoarces viviparus TaxID=48416 RepID=A0AAW1FQI6_ZOAVI
MQQNGQIMHVDWPQTSLPEKTDTVRGRHTRSGNCQLPAALEGDGVADKEPTDSQWRSTCGTPAPSSRQSQCMLFTGGKSMAGKQEDVMSCKLHD